MAVGDNRKNPRIRGVSGTRQVTSIVVNNPQGTQQGSSDTATWATKNNQDLIPSSKLPPTSSPIDQNAVDARVRAGVYPWGLQNNNDPIPRDKLTNAIGSSEASLLLTAKEATLTLPTLAETTLTAVTANTYVYQALAGFSGSGVASYIVPSVVSGVGRITFPNEGFISGNVTASINVHSDSTIGARQSSGHLSVIVTLYNHDDTIKETWKHTEALSDPITQDIIDPVSISINMTPIAANSYITIQIGFESTSASRTAVVDIPAPSANRREQLDIVYYTKEQVANWAKEGNAGLIPVGKLPTSATEGLNQSEVDARILPFAREGNTDIIPANKLPPGNQGGGGAATWATPGNTDTIPKNKLPAGIGGDNTEPWAEKGNKDPIPGEKLSNLLEKVNKVNILKEYKAGSSSPERITTLQLPTNFATEYKYLVIGNDGEGEYGIIDVQYLNALPDTTLAITSQANPLRYTWTKATRTIGGQINGAYLYGFSKGRIFQEDGWLRARETTIAPIVPTTASNDGLNGINANKNTVDSFHYFTCSLFGPGTVQFLPNEFYKDIDVGSNRIFRVYDESNRATLKVTRDSDDGWSFDSHDQSTGNDNNEMRDIGFVKFGRESIITPANGPTSMTLPPTFKGHDLLIAVTKNDADNYYTMWAVKVKFPFVSAHLNPSTRLFNPAKKIVYASLVTFETETEIKATDVSVDDDNFDNIVGENVQEALDSIDGQLGSTGGGTVTSTPNNGTAFPTTGVVNGDEFNLTADATAKGPDITTAPFTNNFFTGAGWGTFGYTKFTDGDGGLWSIGHSTEDLPDNVLAITNKNVIVADGELTDLLAIVLEAPSGTKVARKLTRTDQTNKDIAAGPNPPHVDSYTYNSDLPAGPWFKAYFLRTGGTGATETIAANMNGIGTSAVTGKVHGGVTKKAGVYRRVNGIWQRNEPEEWAQKGTNEVIPLNKVFTIIATEAKFNALTINQLKEEHVYIVGG